MNYASLSWYEIVAQPILWTSAISMLLLIPLDYFWFFMQWSFQAITLNDMIVRFWNDFVSLLSGFYLILVNNSLINILVLLPLDLLASAYQTSIWFIEVLYLQIDFLIRGVLLAVDSLYELSLYIVLQNESFQNEVSDNLFIYFWLSVWLPWYAWTWWWYYLFPNW